MTSKPLSTNRLKTIFLHGDLARFGSPFQCQASSTAEVISALSNQCDGFAAALRRGRYLVRAGGQRTGRQITGRQITGRQITGRQITGRQITGRQITGMVLHDPVPEYHLHIIPAAMGSANDSGEGKMLLGLTLLGLSFVPGVQAGITSGMAHMGTAIGGATGGELAGFLGSRLLGGAASWLMLAGASEALAPQMRQPAGHAGSTSISVGEPVGEGAAIPLVYGRVRIHDAPVIASGLRVEVSNL